MMDVEEYAKQKGIPVGAIPVEAFKKIQTEGVTLRKAKGDSKAEAFKMLCTDTKELLEKCGAAEGGSTSGFPAACADLGVKHMECLFKKREVAYQLAQSLAGKEVTERVLPTYEDNQKKAMDLIELYKSNLVDGKLQKDVFWG